jgi:hypothetical protein
METTTLENKLAIVADSRNYDYQVYLSAGIINLANAIINKDIDPSDLDLYHIENEFDLMLTNLEERDFGWDNAYDFACFLYGSENVAEPE